MATQLFSPCPSTVCQYCSNSYCDPRILDCLHSYCLQCITTIHDEEGTTNSGSITCPSCQHLTAIPDEGGVASLPVNIRLVNEVEAQDCVVKKLTASPPPSCESCEEESSPSVAYCKDCKDMLCSECWRMHKKQRMSKSHTTYSLDDLREMPQPELVKMIALSSAPICPHHDNQTLDFFCTKCSIPVCVGCTVDRHSKDNGHTVQETSMKRSKIANDVEGLPMKKRKLEQVTESINETKTEVEDCKNEVESVIHESFAKLHQLIDQREAELLAENTQIASAKETHLSTQQEGIQQLTDSISHCISVSSIATNEYSNVQLLAIASKIQNRAIELQQQFTATPLDPCDTFLVAVDINTDKFKKLITQFGGVVDVTPRGPHCSAVVPRRRLGLGATMKVKVITANGQEEALTVGGATVRGMLSYNGGVVNDSLGITDNGDGTYLIDVTTDQQLGQHQLFFVNAYVQGSPFSLDIVPQCDYTKLKDPVQTITGITEPMYIAFSDNGDMFVTSAGDHRIHVYDASGNKKGTIGSGQGSGELQFQSPCGVDINGEVIYVAERVGHRIHQLTTGGEFIGTFGKMGSAIGEFKCPHDVKIGPDGKIYVADRGNYRIQVFNPDWSSSLIMDGVLGTVSNNGHFRCPKSIAFDLSGDVHVCTTTDLFGSSSVKVFTSSGQYVREYGNECIRNIVGIAIDPSGYSLITNCSTNGTLSVFYPNGMFISRVGGLKGPFGVSVSPMNGAIWIADTLNNKLIKY